MLSPARLLTALPSRTNMGSTWSSQPSVVLLPPLCARSRAAAAAAAAAAAEDPGARMLLALLARARAGAGYAWL